MTDAVARRVSQLVTYWRRVFEELAEQRLAEHAVCEMLGKEHDCDEHCPAREREPGWARRLRAQIAAQTTSVQRAGGLGAPPASNDVFTDAVSGLPPVGTPGEVAAALGLHPRTVRRFVELGQLQAIDLGAGGGRGRSSGLRIPRLSVLAFLRRKGGVRAGATGARRTRARPRNP